MAHRPFFVLCFFLVGLKPTLIEHGWDLCQLMKWQILQGPVGERNVTLVRNRPIFLFLRAKPSHITTDTHTHTHIAVRQALWLLFTPVSCNQSNKPVSTSVLPFLFFFCLFFPPDPALLLPRCVVQSEAEVRARRPMSR